MQFVVSGLAMTNPENCPLIFLQPGNNGSLEIIYDAPLLFRHHCVVGMAGKTPGRTR